MDGETFEESFLKHGAGCRRTGGTGPFLRMLAVPEFTSKRSPGADGQCVVGVQVDSSTGTGLPGAAGEGWGLPGTHWVEQFCDIYKQGSHFRKSLKTRFIPTLFLYAY